MKDFYFAYGYNKKKKTASIVCRKIGVNFERYDWRKRKWIKDMSLSRILIGEDVFYDEISEKTALELIKNREIVNA